MDKVTADPKAEPDTLASRARQREYRTQSQAYRYQSVSVKEGRNSRQMTAGLEAEPDIPASKVRRAAWARDHRRMDSEIWTYWVKAPRLSTVYSDTHIASVRPQCQRVRFPETTLDIVDTRPRI